MSPWQCDELLHQRYRYLAANDQPEPAQRGQFHHQHHSSIHCHAEYQCVAYPMFVFLGLMLFVVKNVGGGSAKYFVKQQQSLGKVNGFIEEMIGGQKVVKVFCHEEQNQKDFDVLNNEFCENATKANTYANIMMPIMGNLGHLQYVLVAIVGGLLAIAAVPNSTLTGIGTMTLGQHCFFLQLSRSFTMPISQFPSRSTLSSCAGWRRAHL